MAYGLKYKAYHWTVDGLQKEIRFHKDGYAGAVTTWLTEKTGIKVSQGSSDELFPKEAIVTSQREFTFIFKERYDLTEFVYNRKSFKVEIYLVAAAQVEWSGWVEPWDAQHDYAKEPYIASLTAGCGLSQLSRKRYVNNDLETDKTELLILQECLSLMGSTLPLRVSIHLKEVNYVSDVRYGLLSAKIDTNRYYEDSGDRLYCDVIVNDILQKFTAQLFQYNNRWLIISTPDQALATHTTYVEYPGIGEAPSTVESWDTDYITNRSVDEDESALTLDGGTVRILPPVNKYHIHGDYNPRKGFFKNGDLRLWDAGGLLYWNFLHMPAGVPGWQKVTTGNAEYPFALKVNGQGPTILRWYKEHWYSKRKLKEFEPPVYIESSMGVFPPRNNIKLSFEYYTGVNVFAIAIRLSSSTNPDKVRWFRADGSSAAQWLYISIAEANEGNGKTKKGKFEISIDLKYLNTISRDSSAPWEPYNQVHVRFYQSYPGAGETAPYYKIYNLLGSSEQQNGLTFLDGIYDTELQYLAETDEEGEKIDLITGDYAQGWTGTTIGSFTGEPTMYWTRRGNAEEITIYRAMMLDRLAMTRFPVRVLEGDVKILPGKPPLHYLNILKLTDIDNARFKIVRFEYEEYRRIAKVTAIEIKYNAVPAEALVQSTYIRGGKVYFENGESDGLIPGESDDSGAIIGDDQVPLTDDEIETDIDDRLPNTIFIDPIPYIHFAKDAKSTQVVNLEDYYTEEHTDPDTLTGDDVPEFSLSLVSKPSWVSSVTFNGLVVTATAKPTEEGYFFIVVLLTDATSGKSIQVKLPVFVSNIKAIPTLIDVNGATTIGTLPGTFKLINPWDIKLHVTGYHNNVKMILTGPDGVLMDEFMYAPDNESDLASYRCFPDTDGTTTGEGVFSLQVWVLAKMIEVIVKTYYFTLYTDETFLSKSKFELWNAAKIGDISIQDDSKFKYPGWFTPREIIADLEHDKVIQTLSYEGTDGWEEIKVTTFDLGASETAGEYDVYSSPQVNQKAGNYRIHGRVELSGDVVMERQNDFAILAKLTTPEGGLTYGTMIDGTANFVPVLELPITGAIVNLPDLGWNIQSKLSGIEFDYIEWQNMEKVANTFTEFSIFAVSKKQNFISYTSVQTESEVLAFWEYSSIDAGKHLAPSSFRFKFIYRLGGANGDIVGIKQGEITFRVPIADEDLSGLRFIHINNSTGVEVVVDPNMPKTGGKYALPVFPWLWSVSYRKLKSGLEFDSVSLAMAQGAVDLHNAAYGTDVIDYPVIAAYGYPGNVTTELKTDLEAYIFGTPAGDHRTLLNPSNSPVNIDVPGSYVVAASPYRFGTLMELISASFELVESEEVPETDPGECCVPFTQLIGDGSATSFFLDHMKDSVKLHVTIRDAVTGKEVFVDNEVITSNQIKVGDFFEAPATDSYLVIIE